MISVSTATTPSRPGLKSLVVLIRRERYPRVSPPRRGSPPRVKWTPGAAPAPEPPGGAPRFLEAGGAAWGGDGRGAGADVREPAGTPLPQATLDSVKAN